MKESTEITITISRDEAEKIIAKYIRHERELPTNVDVRCELDADNLTLDGMKCRESAGGQPQCTGGTVLIFVGDKDE